MCGFGTGPLQFRPLSKTALPLGALCTWAQRLRLRRCLRRLGVGRWGSTSLAASKFFVKLSVILRSRSVTFMSMYLSRHTLHHRGLQD